MMNKTPPHRPVSLTPGGGLFQGLLGRDTVEESALGVQPGRVDGR